MITIESKVKLKATGEVGVVKDMFQYPKGWYATVILDQDYRNGNRWHDYFQIDVNKLEEI